MEKFLSPYIVAPLISWLLAQTLKLFLRGKGHRHTSLIDLYNLYRSGGMPSAHSAVVVSLATIVGLKLGFNSAEFGIAGIMAMIVIYDSVNVRYIVGEHGRMITKLLAEHKGLRESATPPKIIRGHKLDEVVAGSVLGVLVAFAILFLENS